MTLDELGVRSATDKSSLRHHYLNLYELIFRRLRKRPISLLEIGVQFGCSIRLWKEYFAHGFIVGVDAVDNGIELESDRCQMFFKDAYTNEAVATIGNYRPFNIIIDDGSHTPEHQQFVVKNYSHLLSPDGVLVVEDVLAHETIPSLKGVLPEGFSYSAIDMIEGLKGLALLADSRLFLVWRK